MLNRLTDWLTVFIYIIYCNEIEVFSLAVDFCYCTDWIFYDWTETIRSEESLNFLTVKALAYQPVKIMQFSIKIFELEPSLDTVWTDILIIHLGAEKSICGDNVAIGSSILENIPNTNCYLHITVRYLFATIDLLAVM